MAASPTPELNSSAPTPTLAQVNAQARQLVLANSVNMMQSVFSTTISGTISASNNIVNFNPRMVGFLKRFFVEVTGTITNTGSTAASIALSPMGATNLLSNVTLTDLSNNVRINTTGAHLHLLASAKRGWPFASSLTKTTGLNTGGVAFGTNIGFNNPPATIPKTTGNTSTFTWIFEIPITYSDSDLRGGIWLGTTGQTMNVQLSLNPTSVSASGDAVNSVYNGDTGTLSNVSINVYQHYLDQIPYGKTGPILPVMDMSVLYLLNQTTNTGIVANQDFPIPYANFRDFLSTIALVDNAGAQYAGTDINYFALTAANFTNFFKTDTYIQTLGVRNRLKVDFPAGWYYFDHRHKPVSTNMFGNMQLVVNAGNSTQALGSNSYVQTFYEMFALVNLVGQAGSLSTGT